MAVDACALSPGPATKRIRPIDRARIRVESGCDELTIKRYPHVRDASALRIELAASKLGIELPGREP